jgi:signal transduction histidine kinase
VNTQLKSHSRELVSEAISPASLRELIDACPYPVAKVDRAWNITYSNVTATEVLFARESPIGKNYGACFPAQEHEPPSQSRYHPAMDEKTAVEFTTFLTAPLNLWMSISARPISDGIVIFFRDITLERQTFDALIKAEHLSSLGRLTAAIAHEIRNPLEAVTNLLYLAQQSREMDDLKDYLYSAERELGRASSIVSETLRFNRNSVLSLVSCDSLVREVLLLQREHLLNARIQTDTRSLRSAQVLCKEGEIRQILSNLVANAIDAMSPAGGRLVIRTRNTTRKAMQGTVITVADTGIGMSHYTLARSFDPFFTTKNDQGNGLGLWISRELAGRHGGVLKAKSSQRAGQSGSVFQLFLPTHPADPLWSPVETPI